MSLSKGSPRLPSVLTFQSILLIWLPFFSLILFVFVSLGSGAGAWVLAVDEELAHELAQVIRQVRFHGWHWLAVAHLPL